MGQKGRAPAGPTTYDVERLVRGELGSERAEVVEAELARVGRGAELDALRASDQEILRRYPPAEVLREIERRRGVGIAGTSVESPAGTTAASAESGATRSRRGWLLLPGLGAAAAASALVVVFLGVPPGGRPGSDGRSSSSYPGGETEVIGLRGGEARLHIYRRTAGAGGTADGAIPLTDGARVKPGEVLQVRYVSASAAFGLIVSVDARGQVSHHWPEGGERAAPLQPSGERALPHAFELDDSPGFERFVFVTAPSAFAARPVIEALAAGRPLPLGPGARATEITLVKDVP